MALILYICKTAFNSLHVVVPVLSYLLMKEDITLEEVNGHAVDVVFAGVDTVRILEETKYSRTSPNGHLSGTPKDNFWKISVRKTI